MDILEDLYNVGKTKALGYLPLPVIANQNKSIEDFVDYAKQCRLKHLIIAPFTSMISDGALYLYDEKLLLDLLRKHSKFLAEEKISYKKPKKFIRYISNHTVSKSSPVYKIIGKAFGDKRFIEENSM